MNTKVGFGQNKGSGSEAENQQNIDELGRYAEQEDSKENSSNEFSDFVSNRLDSLFASADIDPYSFQGLSLEDADKEKTKNNCQNAISAMVSAMPDYERSAITSLLKKNLIDFSLIANRKSNCAYCPTGGPMVFISTEEALNNGGMFMTLNDTFSHEFGHAIDGAALLNKIGEDEYFDVYEKSGSASVTIKLSNGKTFMQTVIDELNNENIRNEFIRMVNESDESNGFLESSKVDENKAKGILSNLYKDATEFMKSSGVELPVGLEGLEDFYFSNFEDKEYRYEDNIFVGDSQKEVLRKFVNQPNIVKMFEEYDSLIESSSSKKEKARESSMNASINANKTFGSLSDMVCACNIGTSNLENGDVGDAGKLLTKLVTIGHPNKYYKDNPNAIGMECFANVSNILCFGSDKERNFLQKYAPNTINAFREICLMANA